MNINNNQVQLFSELNQLIESGNLKYTDFKNGKFVKKPWFEKILTTLSAIFNPYHKRQIRNRVIKIKNEIYKIESSDHQPDVYVSTYKTALMGLNTLGRRDQKLEKDIINKFGNTQLIKIFDKKTVEKIIEKMNKETDVKKLDLSDKEQTQVRLILDYFDKVKQPEGENNVLYNLIQRIHNAYESAKPSTATYQVHRLEAAYENISKKHPQLLESDPAAFTIKVLEDLGGKKYARRFVPQILRGELDLFKVKNITFNSREGDKINQSRPLFTNFLLENNNINGTIKEFLITLIQKDANRGNYIVHDINGNEIVKSTAKDYFEQLPKVVKQMAKNLSDNIPQDNVQTYLENMKSQLQYNKREIIPNNFFISYQNFFTEVKHKSLFQNLCDAARVDEKDLPNELTEDQKKSAQTLIFQQTMLSLLFANQTTTGEISRLHGEFAFAGIEDDQGHMILFSSDLGGTDSEKYPKTFTFDKNLSLTINSPVQFTYSSQQSASVVAGHANKTFNIETRYHEGNHNEPFYTFTPYKDVLFNVHSLQDNRMRKALTILKKRGNIDRNNKKDTLDEFFPGGSRIKPNLKKR